MGPLMQMEVIMTLLALGAAVVAMMAIREGLRKLAEWYEVWRRPGRRRVL